MKYRILSFTSIIIGVILALFMIRGSEAIQVEQVFHRITSLILQGITFLTVILLMTSLCISTNQLLRSNKFWNIIRYFFTSTIIIYLVTQLLAFLVGKISFLPKNRIPDISQVHSSLSIFGLNAETWDTMQNTHSFFSWIFAFSDLSASHYLIWFAFVCAIAFIMLHDMEIAEPSYNLLDSISRLIFRLLQNIFSLLSIYLIIYIFYTVWKVRSNALLIFYMGFFVRLIIITVLLLILSSLFLFFVYKDKKSYLFLWNSFVSIFTSFLLGNAIFSMASLIVEQKNCSAMPRNIAGILNPLNILFLRPGSAIVLSYSFITYYSSNTRWQLNFFPEVFWSIIMPIAFAIIIGLYSIPNYFMVLPFYFVLFGIGTIDTFVIMTPILLLGQSFANSIDLLSWNLSNYIYDRFYSDAINC